MKHRYGIIIYSVLIIVLTFWAVKIDEMIRSKQNIPRMEAFTKIVDYISTYYVDDVDWDKAFDASIPGLFSVLDPHSVYISPEEVKLNEENFQGRYEGIGIQFDIIEDTLTVITLMAGSPAEQVGIMPGDKIIAIDSLPAVTISTSEVMRRLKGPKGSTVDVEIMRCNVDSLLTFTLTRDEIPIMSLNTSFIFRNDIGYISLNRFAQNTDKELDEALSRLKNKGMNRLILDLRGNAGGFLDQAVKVAARFIEGDKMIVETRGRIPNFNETYYTGDFGERLVYDIPLIVLINHGSASASEIVAGALQDYDRGLLAGMPSFGKGLVQREYPLPDNGRLRLTISKYYTPSGRLIQRPYKDKTLQEYYDEDKQDTSKIDSLSYYTVSGRKVYSRGGITPDTLLQAEDEIDDAFMADLRRQRIVFAVASRFAANHPELKKDFDWYVDYFHPEERLIRQVIRLAQSKGIISVIAVDNQLIKLIAKRLKTEIARCLWNSERYYQVLLVNDSLIRAAGNLFPLAEKIMIGVNTGKKRN
jgi:carboxyl-terminal processing protease